MIGKHRDAVAAIEALEGVPAGLRDAAHGAWDDALQLGRRYGYRNAQATVLAPTGTIAFMMDCDTTGVEPDIALVKYKNLSGGGYLKIVNRTVPAALARLGYDAADRERIVAHIDAQGTIEGAPGLDAAHLPIFDCAFKAANGERSIEPMGHVRMMGAAQPFLSGAISKTVNVPEAASAGEIMQTYIDAWKLGVKAVAIYRDNSKRIQPLETTQRVDGAKLVAAEAPADYAAAAPVPSSPADAPTIVDEAVTPPAYRRHRLPDDRHAVIHKFSVGEHEGYLTVGEYAGGEPGELFIHISKEGSTVSGLMDAVGALTSVALQSGVPVETLVRKFSHSRFEPSGWTRNPQMGYASSILDYVFRWMGMRYLDSQRSDVAAGQAPLPLQPAEPAPPAAGDGAPSVGDAVVPDFLSTLPMASATQPRPVAEFQNQLDAPLCPECGHVMVRNGSCYRCLNCGATSGCS